MKWKREKREKENARGVESERRMTMIDEIN
jgi:hypothetical protein